MFGTYSFRFPSSCIKNHKVPKFSMRITCKICPSQDTLKMLGILVRPFQLAAWHVSHPCMDPYAHRAAAGTTQSDVVPDQRLVSGRPTGPGLSPALLTTFSSPCRAGTVTTGLHHDATQRPSRRPERHRGGCREAHNLAADSDIFGSPNWDSRLLRA